MSSGSTKETLSNRPESSIHFVMAAIADDSQAETDTSLTEIKRLQVIEKDHAAAHDLITHSI